MPLAPRPPRPRPSLTCDRPREPISDAADRTMRLHLRWTSLSSRSNRMIGTRWMRATKADTDHVEAVDRDDHHSQLHAIRLGELRLDRRVHIIGNAAIGEPRERFSPTQ